MECKMATLVNWQLVTHKNKTTHNFKNKLNQTLNNMAVLNLYKQGSVWKPKTILVFRFAGLFSPMKDRHGRWTQT